MSSPAQSNAEETSTGSLSFNFCVNCSNLLHPVEDKQNRQLRYRCRTCYYSKEAANPCISMRTYVQNQAATAGVTQDVGEDPTVGDASSLVEQLGNFSLRSPSTSSRVSFGSSDSEDTCTCTMCGEQVTCEDCGLFSEEMMAVSTSRARQNPSRPAYVTSQAREEADYQSTTYEPPYSRRYINEDDYDDDDEQQDTQMSG